MTVALTPILPTYWECAMSQAPCRIPMCLSFFNPPADPVMVPDKKWRCSELRLSPNTH